ncbi:MAG: hypothetical protein Q8L88_14520, partial [Bacteroidota bacterium]|nr:hypothetical protein [Bacteroidota bacterium]
MKKISSIAIALIIGMSLLIGDQDHAESKLYASFTMSITDLNDVPDHDSERGENLIRLEFPKGKEPFYLNVVTRRGKQSNTFQLGIRGTRSNKAIFCGTNLSVNSTYTIAFSIENRNEHDRRDEKNSAIAKLWINPDFDAPECTENLLQRVKEFPFSLTEMILHVAPRFSSQAYIYNERTASEWGLMALPVELVSFSATAKGKNVELKWNTATEVNNYGFEIERSVVSDRHLQGDGYFSWTKIGFVEGNGTTNAPKLYSFVDASASGKVLYRLKQIDR